MYITHTEIVDWEQWTLVISNVSNTLYIHKTVHKLYIFLAMIDKRQLHYGHTSNITHLYKWIQKWVVVVHNNKY